MMACAASLAIAAACGRATTLPPEPPLPQTSGTVAVAGLTAPVGIIRDRWGVPHITAAGRDAVFFAQGFVQAQDRLFQMDLWRRSAQGRLAEVLGPNFIQRDIMTRRVQYRGTIDLEWASYGPELRTIATAFTNGINAWVAIVRTRLPLEFALAGWTPEFWAPEDLLNRTDAFMASGDAADEVFRARLVAAVGGALAQRLLPLDLVSSGTLPVGSTIGGVDVSAVSPMVADALRSVGARPFFSGFAEPLPKPPGADQTSGARSTAVPLPMPAGSAALSLPTPAAGSRSTAWAVGPLRTGTPAPLVAADSHRLLENPSQVYIVHLMAPGWNVAGATPPWLPGVAVGHNDQVAWAMTAANVDTQDLYVERVNPSNPRQVESAGRWVDMAVETDSLLVKGRKEPFEYETFFTRNGLVIAVDSDRHLAYTLRWTGTEPGTAGGLAATVIDRAESVEGLRQALGRWKAPAAEFVFADRAGRIGRQTAALSPRRVARDGALPTPGWVNDHGWLGWMPTDTLAGPSDPRSGYIALAGGEPRTRRLEQLFAGSSSIDVDLSKQFQHDVVSWSARELVPLLDRVQSPRAEVEDARNRLLQWNGRIAADSSEAALFVVWEARLRQRLAERRLPPDVSVDYSSRAASTLRAALVSPSRLWFGRDVVGARDAMLGSTLAEAVDDVARRSGSGTKAAWGMFNAVTFHHRLAITERARPRFNIGPFPASGYADTLLSISGRIDRFVGPSFQMIASLADWDGTLVSLAPGQSEWPASPHFGDLAKLWAEGAYFPLAFSDALVRANAEATLTLVPAR